VVARQEGAVVRRSRSEHARAAAPIPVLLLFTLSLAALQICAPVAALERPSPASQEESTASDASPEALLERLARVAQLYNDNALRFSCDEEITYTLFGASGRVQDRRKYNLEYMYIYEAGPELPPGGEGERHGRLADYRTIRDDDAPEGSYREIELEDLALPNYLKQAYSWAFIFEEARQHRYEFEILGQERVHGTEALILGFDPIPPYVRRVNDWFGKIWIDKESSQILRVEARSSDSLTDESPTDGQKTEEPAEGGTTFTVTSVITEFAIEKNGMRFPSHAILTASVSRRFGEGAHVVAALSGDVGEYETEVRTVFRVDQTYDDYRFFNVRSEAEIRDFVLGVRQS
jgi:hypothetical protein